MDTLLEGNLAVPTWLCDAETRTILAANPAALRLLGYSEEDLRDRPIEALLVPEQSPTLVLRAFPVLDDPVLAGRWRLRRKDGSEAAVDIASFVSAQDGRRARALFALETGEGPAREKLLSDLFFRAQQQTVLVSLARESTAPTKDLRSLLGRMLRAAALALEGNRLSIWMRSGRSRTLHKLVDSDEGETAAPGAAPCLETIARYEVPLPLQGPGSGVLRCSRLDGARGWSVQERAFLEAVASLTALAVERHTRPGSVREFKQVIRRALAGAIDDVFDPESAPASQDQLIRNALKATGGNRTAAAKLLGISRVTLWKKLKRLGEPGEMKSE